MKKWYLPCILSLSLVSCSSQVRHDQRTIDASYYDRLLTFMMDTGSQILLEESENILYSPTALYDPLSLLFSLCDEHDQIEYELINALGDDIDSIRSQWNAYQADIRKGMKQYHMKNHLFYQEGEIFQQDALLENCEYFHYELHGFDFAQGGEPFAAFIRQETGGMLDAKAEDFEHIPDYNFALLQTSYYQGSWLHPFTKKNSRVFHREDQTTQEVSFIEKREEVRFYNDSQIEAIWMDGLDGASFLFLRPYHMQDGQYDPLDTLLEDPGRLTRVVKHLQEKAYYTNQTMRIALPEFEAESQLSLSSFVQEILGIETIFTHPEEAFSSLMYEKQTLHMMPIQQWTKWKMKEKEMTIAHGPYLQKQQEKEIIFDSPFIYLILSNTGIPLYMGTVRSL